VKVACEPLLLPFDCIEDGLLECLSALHVCAEEPGSAERASILLRFPMWKMTGVLTSRFTLHLQFSLSVRSYSIAYLLLRWSTFTELVIAVLEPHCSVNQRLTHKSQDRPTAFPLVASAAAASAVFR
jgi:hypothetical protein